MRCKNCGEELDLLTVCQDFCTPYVDKDESLDDAGLSEELRVAKYLLTKLQDELISRENYVKELKNTLENNRQQWMKKEQLYLDQIADFKKQICLERDLKASRSVPSAGENQYKANPVLLHKCTSRNCQSGGSGISGIAVMNCELFILSQRSHDVEVYDADTFAFKRSFHQAEILNPSSIEACIKLSCLFIADLKYSGQESEILRIDSEGNVLGRWNTGDAWGILSLTVESNILLTESEHGKIIEYSPDGELLSEILLKPTSGIKNPWYSVKLTSNHFLVSHGHYKDEAMHRVCIINRNGDILKSYGGRRGSERGSMNMPLGLAVDSCGFIFVVDAANKRVLILNSKLEFQRELIKPEHGLQKVATKMCLDEPNGRLFMVENRLQDGKFIDSALLIFNIK